MQEIADSLTKQGIRSPRGMERWIPRTIGNILRNEKYCGDVLYQKTYTKDYLTHRSVRNRDLLTQWHWENDHPAIIKREDWNRVQEILRSGRGRIRKPLSEMKRRFSVARVKSGALRGYFLLDMNWSKEEREQFIKIIESVNGLEDQT